MEAYEALASRKKALAVAAVALGLIGTQGAGVAYGQEETTTGGGTTAAPTPGPGGGDTVITEDDDRVGAGDVLVIEGGYVAEKGASLVLKDADGTTGSLVDGKNARFEKGEGETLRLEVTKEPAGLKGGDEALSTDGLAVESSEGIEAPPAEETPPPGETTGGGTTAAPETTGEEPSGGPTAANQPEVLGPQETTAPNGETPNGRPVEIGEESAVDAGDVLLVEGGYEVAEGATLVLADADDTTGTLVDGGNAEFTAGEGVLEVAVTGNVMELSGGDGELTLEGLAVKESDGITSLGGDATTTGSTEPSEEPEADEPEAEEPKPAEEPDEIPVGDPNRVATPEAQDETTALTEETTALTEETTDEQPPEETGGPLTVPEDEGTVPNEECAGAAEIETFSGSEGMTTAPFETAGGSFQVVYEVAREGASEDEGQGGTTVDGGTTADGGAKDSGQFGLTIVALEHESGERVAEEAAEAATGEMMVETGPGLYALEIAPVKSEYAVTVMDCQEEDSPEEDPREGTAEEPPTPEEINDRYGDPGRIVEEERKETPPAPSPDEGTLLPARLPDTGGAAAVALPVASVLLGLGILGGALLRNSRGR